MLGGNFEKLQLDNFIHHWLHKTLKTAKYVPQNQRHPVFPLNKTESSSSYHVKGTN